MKNNFRTLFNRTTKEIPLEKDDFKYELDSDFLFDQYYLQVKLFLKK